ncbi:MAG: hypothetical protein ACPGTG_06345, partial [Flavobacteriales bacterium]
TETYRLSFLRIKDELAIEDSKTNTVDNYIATYELYNVGSTEDYLKIDAKKRKTNSKKNVFEYSNFNVSDTTLDHIRPILRNKEQNSNLMILKNRPTTP